jgi:hypothetical protein
VEEVHTHASQEFTNEDATDRARIREIIEAFVVWFDSGDFARFRTVWHPGGVMNTTRGRISASDFTAGAEAKWSAGAGVGAHLLAGSSIDVAGNRAVAQTKVTLSSRMPIDGIVCDAVCIARFYDFFERQDGRWGIVERQPIYERDRLDPVTPVGELALDATLLARFPEGYRYLAYAQTKNGLEVRTDLPGLRGPAVERLYARGHAWLAGEDLGRHAEKKP